MELLLRALLILGFCVGTVGAAGFGESIEAMAWPLFGGGLALVIGAGLILRLRLKRRDAEGEGSIGVELAETVARIAHEVDALAESASELGREEFCRRTDALLNGPFFDLGSRNEELLRRLGAGVYASIWDGFATAERLLARAWSMATDDHLAEGLEELPRARRAIDRAATAAAAAATSSPPAN